MISCSFQIESISRYQIREGIFSFNGVVSRRRGRDVFDQGVNFHFSFSSADKWIHQWRRVLFEYLCNAPGSQYFVSWRDSIERRKNSFPSKELNLWRVPPRFVTLCPRTMKTVGVYINSTVARKEKERNEKRKSYTTTISIAASRLRFARLSPFYRASLDR